MEGGVGELVLGVLSVDPDRAGSRLMGRMLEEQGLVRVRTKGRGDFGQSQQGSLQI